MLRNLNTLSARGRLVHGTPFVGKTASELATGFTLPGLLANDVLSGDPVGCFYRNEVLVLPANSANEALGDFVAYEDGSFSFTGAPDGTYTASEKVWKFDPKNGLMSAESTTLSLTVGAATQPPVVTGVSISPSAVTSAGGGTRQFTATVTGTGAFSSAVNWSTTGGQISSSGLLTEPAATSVEQQVTVTVTSAANPLKFATAIVTIAAVTLPPASVTVPPARTAKFAGRSRVAVFSGNAPVVMLKGPLDELYFIGDFSKDCLEAGTTAVSVAPVSTGVVVLEAPYLQNGLGVVKLGALDMSAAKNTFTFRVALANGEQVDRTIDLKALDDAPKVFGKDPDDKRFYTMDFSSDATFGGTALASVSAPVAVGVSALSTAAIQGNAATVKIGGLDVGAGAGSVNSYTLTAVFANTEKIVRSIYFKQEDH